MSDNANFNLNIGEKLKKARIKKGLSQQEFGNLINCSHSTIGSYERGRLNISTKKLIKISEILEVPITYFIKEEEKIKQQENNKEKYNLSDNIEFSMEMSIRTFLKAKNLSKEEINQKVINILEFILKDL